MLNGEALDLAFVLRGRIGALAQGDGPSVAELREATGLPDADLDRALAELESVGFVRIARHPSGADAVLVLAPMQIYLDDLEGQGTDDL